MRMSARHACAAEPRWARKLPEAVVNPELLRSPRKNSNKWPPHECADDPVSDLSAQMPWMRPRTLDRRDEGYRMQSRGIHTRWQIRYRDVLPSGDDPARRLCLHIAGTIVRW